MYNHRKEYLITLGYAPLLMSFLCRLFIIQVFLSTTMTLYLLNVKAIMVGRYCVAVGLTILSDVIIVTCQKCLSFKRLNIWMEEN